MPNQLSDALDRIRNLHAHEIAAEVEDPESLGLIPGRSVPWRALAAIQKHLAPGLEVTHETITQIVGALALRGLDLPPKSDLTDERRSRVAAHFYRLGLLRYEEPKSIEYDVLAIDDDGHNGTIAHGFQTLVLWFHPESGAKYTLWSQAKARTLYVFEVTDADGDRTDENESASDRFKRIGRQFRRQYRRASGAESSRSAHSAARSFHNRRDVQLQAIERLYQQISTSCPAPQGSPWETLDMRAAIRGRMLTIDSRSLIDEDRLPERSAMHSASDSDLLRVPFKVQDQALMTLGRRMEHWPGCVRFLLDVKDDQLLGYVSGAPLREDCVISVQTMRERHYNLSQDLVMWPDTRPAYSPETPYLANAFLFASLRLDPSEIDIEAPPGARQAAYEAAATILTDLASSGLLFRRAYVLTHQNHVRTWATRLTNCDAHRDREQVVTRGHRNNLAPLPDDAMVARFHLDPWRLDAIAERDGGRAFEELRAIYKERASDATPITAAT